MSDALSPDSRRRRGLWWKVPLIGLAALLFLAFIAHGLWRKSERNRLEATIAQIKARGEPIEPGDWVETLVADETNLVVLIREAAKALVKDDGRSSERRDIEYADPTAFELPLTTTERTLLQAEVVGNLQALNLLGQVHQRPGIAWNDPPVSLGQALTEDVSHLRALANLASDSARIEADSGDPSKALAQLAILEPLARASDAKTSLVGHLVGTGIRALQADRLIELAPFLDLADPSARADLQKRIGELLDASELQKSARDGLCGERTMVHCVLRPMAGGSLTTTTGATTNPYFGYFARPLIDRNERLVLDYIAEALRLIDAPDLPTFNARSAKLHQLEAENRQAKLAVLASIFTPSLGRSFETRFYTVTDRHLAATALALRLYQADHDGQRPKTLDELVPAYLPSVPMDAISGKPLRYDRTRAILWSVGRDGVDDEGDETAPLAAGRDRWRSKDAVVHLDRVPRPATQPADAEATMP